MKYIAFFLFIFATGCISFIKLSTSSEDLSNPIPGEDIYWQDIVEKAPITQFSVRQPTQQGLTKTDITQPLTALTDPILLENLEKEGYRLENLISEIKDKSLNLNSLNKQSLLYRNFVQYTQEDISLRVDEENKYRPDWGKVGISFNEKRRHLDPNWLTSNYANFDLVGVINRIDRKVFDKNHCGELRFIYRLNYQTPKISSRMPMTINMVYNLPKINACADYVKLWVLPKVMNPKELTQWFKSGALHSKFVSLNKLKALETNYQVIRSSSGIRNLLGGSAEYVLRVFTISSNTLVRTKLENTIDPNDFVNNPSKRQKLLSFLKKENQFKALDEGYLKIPDEFLTYSASSYSPHGISRSDNRLFDKIFTEKDFADLNFSKTQFVKTPDSVIRRLNDLSCVGCHQNRTVAGFHFLGEDKSNTHPLNAILFSGSGHFRAEQKRRVNYLNSLLKNNTVDESRAFSIAPTEKFAQAGDFCGLKGSKGFYDWVCDKDLECRAIDNAVNDLEMGKCVPTKLLSGDPCIENQLIQNHHALDKMILPTQELACANGNKEYTCQSPGGGFPTGMCTSSCKNIQDNEREICGPIAGPGFHDCLTGTKMTFVKCLEKTEKTASRGRCNEKISCRNDYICAKVSGSEGACLPSYFLYQIRVDGHPSP